MVKKQIEITKRSRLVVSSANFNDYAGSLVGEEGGGISETVPDQSLTLRQLLTRYSQGQPVSGFEPTYSEEFIPDFRNMDLAEVQEYRERIINTQNDLIMTMDAATRVIAERELNIDLSGYPIQTPDIQVNTKTNAPTQQSGDAVGSSVAEPDVIPAKQA